MAEPPKRRKSDRHVPEHTRCAGCDTPGVRFRLTAFDVWDRPPSNPDPYGHQHREPAQHRVAVSYYCERCWRLIKRFFKQYEDAALAHEGFDAMREGEAAARDTERQDALMHQAEEDMATEVHFDE